MLFQRAGITVGIGSDVVIKSIYLFGRTLRKIGIILSHKKSIIQFKHSQPIFIFIYHVIKRVVLLDRFIALTTAPAAISGNATTTAATTLPERLLPFLNVGDELSTIVMFDLAIIMVIAAVMAAVSFRLKQPMILGYIIAGIVIGPFTPPFPRRPY